MQQNALASALKLDDTSSTPNTFVTSELRTSHLFTPQQLCGDTASSLARHAVFLERAKTEAGRDELAVKVTLAAYLVVRLVDAYFSAAEGDVGENEGLAWQVGAVRRHVSELPADHAEVGHLAGIVDAVACGSEATATLRISLTAYAYYLEHEGRFGEALELVMLASQCYGAQMTPADFAGCALFAGRLSRRLACWTEAIAFYASADEAARVIGDDLLQLKSRLGVGLVCRGQGNLPKAKAIAEEVLHRATALNLAEMQLGAYTDLSAIYASQGNKVEALRADYQAFLLAPDTATRMRTLGNLGVSFVDVGAYDAARLAFDIVLKSQSSFGVRGNALLELMDLESKVGNRVAFERLRAAAEADRSRMAPAMIADYLQKAGVGLARFGQSNRAREVLNSALAFAETYRLNAWYFKIEAAIRDLDQSLEQPTKELERVSVIQEMEAGLRDYAALQPA